MDEKFGISYMSENALTFTAASEIRARVNEVLERELALAKEIIEKNANAMNKLVDTLMEKNHLNGPQIDDILSKYIVK